MLRSIGEISRDEYDLFNIKLKIMINFFYIVLNVTDESISRKGSKFFIFFEDQGVEGG